MFVISWIEKSVGAETTFDEDTADPRTLLPQ